MRRPSPPISTDVLVRLGGCISQANPKLSPTEAVGKARSMIESLRKAGLDVVFLSWVDDPHGARGAVGDDIDPFLTAMKPFLAELGDRKPWRPD